MPALLPQSSTSRLSPRPIVLAPPPESLISHLSPIDGEGDICLPVLEHSTASTSSTEGSIAPPPTESPISHLSPIDSEDDICLPILEHSTASTSSTDGSLTPPSTELEAVSPLTPIHESDSLIAFDTGIFTIQASLCNSIIVSSATSVVQKAKSARVQTIEARLSYFSPSPAHIPPHASTPFDTLVDPSSFPPRIQASGIRTHNFPPLRHGEVGHTMTHILIEQLSDLVSVISEMTRDASLLLGIHRGMQVVNQERRCMNDFRRQMVISQKIAKVTGSFLAIIENDTTLLDLREEMVSQCLQDMNSIVVNAEVSVATVAKVIACARHERPLNL